MSMEKQVRAILAAQIGLHNTVYVVFMLRLTSLCISIYLSMYICMCYKSKGGVLQHFQSVCITVSVRLYLR